MAPSWALLGRDLLFSHDEAVFAGETHGGRESIKIKGPPSNEDYIDANTTYLRSLKPYARLADPPELSSLSLLQPTKSVPPLCNTVNSACISSADKHLVALYAGSYRPGTHNRGCHLIYDTSKNSLSTIPRLPLRRSHAKIGCHSAIVVCDGDGAGAGYTLAELTWTRVRSSDVGEAALYLWYPSADEWVVKPGRLPLELCTPANDFFSAEMCFSYGRSFVCWVDLLRGMVVCDLRAVQGSGSDPEFRFVPLPDGCPTYGVPNTHDRRICGEEFRSMSCVGGVIKFVTMDGYVDRRPGEDKLALWSLSPDFSGWVKSKVYDLGNIWANEIHQNSGMGKIAPSFPVLSMHEDHVVYLVFTDIRVVADSFTGIRGGRGNKKVECRGQYLLRVDMENSEVQFRQASTNWIIHSQLFASDFSAYRHGLEDHPVLYHQHH